MNKLIALLVLAAFSAGVAVLFHFTRLSRAYEREVAQLEAELGRMTIDDPDQIQLVAVEKPNVPSEVAENIDRIWQFRCYLPPNYDFQRFSGDGRVAEEGLHFRGGFGTSRSMPKAEAYHELMTISLVRKEDRFELFASFGGSSGARTWNGLTSENVHKAELTAQSLVEPGQGARSFDQETILPVLKIFDRRDTENVTLNGESITLYAGSLFVFCPSSRMSDLENLRQGQIPENFEHQSVASGVEP